MLCGPRVCTATFDGMSAQSVASSSQYADIISDIKAAELAVIASVSMEPKISGVKATNTGKAPLISVRRTRSTTSSMIPPPVPPAIDPTMMVSGEGTGVPGGTFTWRCCETSVSSGPPSMH